MIAAKQVWIMDEMRSYSSVMQFWDFHGVCHPLVVSIWKSTLTLSEAHGEGQGQGWSDSFKACWLNFVMYLRKCCIVAVKFQSRVSCSLKSSPMDHFALNLKAHSQEALCRSATTLFLYKLPELSSRLYFRVTDTYRKSTRFFALCSFREVD